MIDDFRSQNKLPWDDQIFDNTSRLSLCNVPSNVRAEEYLALNLVCLKEHLRSDVFRVLDGKFSF